MTEPSRERVSAPAAWPWWRGYLCITNAYYNVHNCWLRSCGRQPAANGRWSK